jgi:hypothetical protein
MDNKLAGLYVALHYKIPVLISVTRVQGNTQKKKAIKILICT